jgi:hypothetical protein
MGNGHPSYLKYPHLSSIILDSKKMTDLCIGGKEGTQTRELLSEIVKLVAVPSLTIIVYAGSSSYMYCSSGVDSGDYPVIVELEFSRQHFVLIYERMHIDLGVYHNHLKNREILEKIRPGIIEKFNKLLEKHGVKAHKGSDGFYEEKTRHLHTGNNCFLIAVVIGIILESSSEMEFLEKKMEGLSLKKEKKEKKKNSSFTNPKPNGGFPPSPMTPPPPPPGWNCGQCTFRNHKYMKCCEMCFNSK